ncbi:uncharacterized protein CG7065 [Lucilia cuprina]|uniref:uncharacterized protein CG7065 n=1 Tax=Lucilia cuprina TaxID=7375 RepID=UPI001F052617|nr:uncharacterized protein CG7065 [Lucilia cuprina]XP_046803515.1 uncharacterized protein CG7065 [Lucilia cuprina]
MNIIPGEPVPPGFEDEVNRQPQIQPSIDQYKGNALIGIEYTVELHEDDRHEPGYLCTLCDKRGDPRTIINHWCSFNHRMKYLEKHYPSAVRECQPVKYKPNSHNIMILIVQRLAEAIEDHHGRLLVSVMNADDFRKRKTILTEQIMKKKHFDEKNGPNFLNAIDRTMWEQKAPFKKHDINKAPKRVNNEKGKPSLSVKDGLDEISSDSDNQDTVKKPKLTRIQQPAFTNKKRDSPLNAEEPEKKLPTPKELSLQASHIAQERYKWEKYRCMLEIQLKQMEKIQADYEKAPEKHPHYPEEWKKFWNRRYKELQAEKKVDPNKYDYKPEWIVFWTKRMKELFNAEVEKKKKEIKIKLGLPEDAEEKVDQLKEKYKLPVNRVPTKSISRGGPAADVIDISDDDSPRHSRYSRSRRSRTRSRSRSPRPRQRDYRRSRSRSRSRSNSRSRSLSPFSDEFEPSSSSKHLHKKHHNPIRPYGVEHPPSDYYPYTRVSRYPPSSSVPSHYPPPTAHYRVLDSSKIPKYQEPEYRQPKETKEEPKEEEPEGPLTVVAVLRLLTALEEHLGSLGPKVVDMLGKALALEKLKGNSSDDLLMNEDHCVFFETIKEKLKGLLIADVLDDQQKVRAVKRAIKNIAALIHQVTTKGPSTDSTKDKIENNNDGASNKTKVTLNKNATGPNIKDLPFDRQTVATKLAAALVMEGREDVSTADMDKLIYMFILMVKLNKTKRETDGKGLCCNDILPALGIATSKLPKTTLSLANLPAIVDDLLEHEVNALVKEVEEEMESEVVANDKEAKNDNNSSMLESLTDSDLQTLLQNFKHLSSEEQHHLIAHLKKLESADPGRVEKLRKFVNISDLTGSKESSNKSNKTSDSTPTKSSTSSKSKTRYDDTPPSGSRKGHNALPPGTEDDDDDDDDGSSRRRVNPNKFSLDDDDDDDYNFEDVFKAASSNVNRLSEEHSRPSKSPIVPVSSSPSALTFNPAGLKTSLNDTQNLIANLMGSLQQSNSNSANKSSPSSSTAKSSIQPSAPQPVPPIAAAASHQQQQTQVPPTQHANQMAFYQQQQQQQQHQAYPPGPYNQMNSAQANYYNSMGGYNQNPYDGYQQWPQGQQQIPPQNMQQFGMQGYGMPPQQMGYNMYGQGRN